ncbi:MAG TPA: hypothetical protein VLC98_08015 [Phnomibacter sp.]|nr:hypothetical protein [Phnomibacter sp.]
MLTPVSRIDIFKASHFADQFMAEMEQAYAADFDKNDVKEAAMLRKYYDHLAPFVGLQQPIDAHGVWAFAAASKAEYVQQFALQLQQALQHLDITSVYLLTLTQTCIASEFPFENFTKRNRFKRLGGIKNSRLGYQVSVEHLPAVFPLFFFSGIYDVPVIFLITAEGATPLSLRLCDDGNLHINYQQAFAGKIAEAATAAKLEMGDTELCSQYSTAYFRNRKAVDE